MTERNDETQITLTIGQLKHLFDLAVDSPTVCSGSFETDDVNLLRRIAIKLKLDPNEITPDEFLSQYPHAFQRRQVFDRYLPKMIESEPDGSRMTRFIGTRPETDEERRRRVDEERSDPKCQVRHCGKEESHAIHLPQTRGKVAS